MAQPIESYFPGVRDNGGLVTNEPVTFGNTVVGALQNLVSLATNATLTVAQSGSTVLYNSTTGILITLPKPTLGVTYNLVVQQTTSTGTHALITDAATTFLLGGLDMGEATGSTNLIAIGNGTSHVAVRFNATTTGGIAGSYMMVTAVSPTVWMMTGQITGSGTLVTPFSTT